MKKWLKRVGAAAVLVILVVIAAVVYLENDEAVLTGYVSEPVLATVKDEWPGTPVDQHGRFMNHEYPLLMKLLPVLRWQLSPNPFAEEKRNSGFRPSVLDPDEFLMSDRNGLMWMGHATFYIRLNGVTMLTDPIFDKPAFVTRYVDVPSPLEKIRRVDYVLLSHDHRDHFDEATLRQIAKRFPNARILAGLNSSEILSGIVTPTNEVLTAGWFQRFDLGESPVEVNFVPVRHWSRRGLLDLNRRLWGGFVIRGAGKSLYFGGDSGYGRHYRETGEVFPGIDYFLIGIGAYEPRWFMEPNHNNPADAVKAFRDVGAHILVPMHYGTFDLSDEPPDAPINFLRSEAEKAGISDRVKQLDIYGHIEF